MSTPRYKCMIENCPNHSDEGVMIGPLCTPCYIAARDYRTNKQETRTAQLSVEIDPNGSVYVNGICVS